MLNKIWLRYFFSQNRIYKLAKRIELIYYKIPSQPDIQTTAALTITCKHLHTDMYRKPAVMSLQSTLKKICSPGGNPHLIFFMLGQTL